jgi:poly(hydroxyalkanoate) depolymerase family esterase
MNAATPWARIRDYFTRLFRGKPPEPGRFVEGSKFSWRGWVGVAPWIWPSRDYLLYLPRGYGGWRRRVMVVLIHGCKQTPDDLATGTGIAKLADARGWLVLLPRQTQKANPWSCWNWFDGATGAGRGEIAIVAAQMRAVRRSYRVHPRRVFIAGMSAGGCLAAALAVRHPEMVAGVIVHSGVGCGMASSPNVALRVMAQGADTMYERIAEQARMDAKKSALPIPLLVIHGDRDSVVAPINAVQLVRQFLVLDGRLAATDTPPRELPEPDATTTVTLADGGTQTTIDFVDSGRTLARLVRVAHLGHAWSGGDESLPYNDSRLPKATTLLEAFIDDHAA